MALIPPKVPAFPGFDMTDPAVRKALENIDANLTLTVEIARLGFVLDEERKQAAMKLRVDSATFFRSTLVLKPEVKSVLLSLHPAGDRLYTLTVEIVTADNKIASSWNSEVGLPKKELLRNIQGQVDLVRN